MSYHPPNNLNWHHQQLGFLHEHYIENRDIFQATGSTNVAWPVANLCLYVPIYVYATVTVYALNWENATPSGNACMGLYDEGGNRIAQTGVVAMSGSSAPQSPSITAFTIPPGRYFAGLAVSNITATLRVHDGAANAGSDSNKWYPIGEEATTGTQVPTVMNPSVSARAYIPILGLRVVSQGVL